MKFFQREETPSTDLTEQRSYEEKDLPPDITALIINHIPQFILKEDGKVNVVLAAKDYIRHPFIYVEIKLDSPDPLANGRGTQLMQFARTKNYKIGSITADNFSYLVRGAPKPEHDILFMIYRKSPNPKP